MTNSSQDKNKKRILIMAGGTGGHIFPGLALAKELIGRGHNVKWLGTKAGMESDLVPKHDIDIHFIPVRGVRGKGVKGLLKAPWNIIASVITAAREIRIIDPQVVVGLGGFVAGPGGFAAKLKNIPLVIHEQNAIPGTTNKLLSKIATRVLTAFPCNLPNSLCIGNPVRKEIESISAPEVRLSQRTGATNVLVVGGSRGALAVNELLPPAIKKIVNAGELNIWHQTGAGKDSAVIEQYEACSVSARVEPFIDDMAEALAWADIVICRAGALTVSELAAAGLGSVLVPFPFAIDDHQTHNALYLSSLGAAILKQQKDLTPDILAEILEDFIFDRDVLIEMANKARVLAKPEAARIFADYCEEVANA
ncbi:MAG: undecaprenyldiphospho-muramoylpentapeptide beta-N-acetylglucosaminyltransferase [Agarilytica sp.]